MWEKEVDVLFNEYSDSQFRISSTERVEYKFEDSFGYNNEKISEFLSEAVFRSSIFAKF